MNTIPPRTYFLLFLLTSIIAIGCSQIYADSPTHDSNGKMINDAQPETPTATSRVPSDICGMWVWRESWLNTHKAQDELLDFSVKHGFNRLLVQIHDIKDAPTYTIRYPKELARLISEASKRGIAVEALDGAKGMALAENQAETLAILDAIIDLNQSLPEGERFAGIHYDIEPYLLDRWKKAGESRRVVMHDLLDFYTLARKKLNDRGSDMLLSSDIPMWYDHKTDPDDNCVLEYNGQTKNLHQHIQDICDYVGIMSYRQKALGPNSVTFHIANELDYAEKIGKKICAALETIEIKDTPQITFYGLPKETFWEQFNLVQKEHEGRPGYAGVLIHCYRGTLELLND